VKLTFPTTVCRSLTNWSTLNTYLLIRTHQFIFLTESIKFSLNPFQSAKLKSKHHSWSSKFHPITVSLLNPVVLAWHSKLIADATDHGAKRVIALVFEGGMNAGNIANVELVWTGRVFSRRKSKRSSWLLFGPLLISRTSDCLPIFFIIFVLLSVTKVIKMIIKIVFLDWLWLRCARNIFEVSFDQSTFLQSISHSSLLPHRSSNHSHSVFLLLYCKQTPNYRFQKYPQVSLVISKVVKQFTGTQDLSFMAQGQPLKLWWSDYYQVSYRLPLFRLKNW